MDEVKNGDIEEDDSKEHKGMGESETHHAVENEKNDESHGNGEDFAYVAKETGRENNINSSPEDEVEREEVCDGVVVYLKDDVELAEEDIAHFPRELV